MISTWRVKLRENFTRMEEFLHFLKLTPAQIEHVLKISPFVLNVPKRLAEKMEKGTLEDPLVRQFLPLKREWENREGFSSDPVGDLGALCGKKLLRKYQGRVLLLVSSACAMHCRYCFRKEFPYERQVSGFEEELQEIAADDTLREVILSGGDPLSLGNEALKILVEQIESIPHIKRLRFHTRFPIGIPERIDEGFLEILERSRLQTWFVVHVNHERELDGEVLQALETVRALGVPVLTHTVLLRGVNDTVEDLKRLFEKLIDQGIQPYYLFQLDKVEGAGHFEVSEEEGLQLMSALTKVLPGYGIPRYAKEVAGMPSKTFL